MAKIDLILRKLEIGIRVMDRINELSDDEVKNFLIQVVGHEKCVKGILEAGEVERIITKGTTSQISVHFHDEIRITAHGIMLVSHNVANFLVEFDDNFITKAIYHHFGLSMTDPQTVCSEEAKEYEVEVCRISYSHCTIKVMAHSQEEAESLALDEAGDHEYSEHDVDYEVN